MGAVGRNDPCPCGSGKKYKQCCLGKAPPAARRKRAILPILMILAGIVVGAYLGVTRSVTLGLASGVGIVILAGVVISFRDPPPPSAGGSDAAAINFGK